MEAEFREMADGVVVLARLDQMTRFFFEMAKNISRRIGN